MCELLGMSANVPTDICFSFTGLMQRGGNTGPHRDGWGITFYEGKGFRTFKDPKPSCRSKIAELVQNYPIKSKAVISHIRQANRGGVNLENTHPFTRELWGRYWTFAHNGQLSGYEGLHSGSTRPVGQTDSELSFCWLLNRLQERYPEPPQDMVGVFRYIAECCDELRELGVFNMLLSDGEYVMTYCTNHLYWITRRAPFGEASLIDEDVTIDFQQETTPNDIVTVIATQPLTDNEEWFRMKPGEYNIFHFGELTDGNHDALEHVPYAEAKPRCQAPTEPLE
ncbi:glutamine amidotransferase class-II [Vibrio nigripulchritudo SFn27]|uniref:Glutamine amidotransferase class-II n=1 Tax=Vibrio nigripulchritudo TaxID=28173 RepID=U4K7A0_9VIBR|nr:class II glutamine amidotransferase [Vibrio nigripulchritudo]CCN84964.1 glutamine amidotransferase class-II [Vibrio nigripulchritudo BLFn1]CCN90176.1 glutamine amidotransferase class-II [Vibrio nigripulchritudo SFn27]CCN94212.1 glutamine amidotransferase class-II [Vibrio nigripulchritudo ENn2]CCO42566.1 glutamine amidotransferase class-II [Vibrio nigripulchritudo SFn135]CCO51331.1 glutamine amidotransferase class-II [Vibrio nigripulchritudo Wn13]